MPRIDARAARASGALSAVMRGEVGRIRRAGRGDAAIAAEVAEPVLELAEELLGAGEGAEVDAMLRHAVHAGVEPRHLVIAMRSLVEAESTPGNGGG